MENLNLFFLFPPRGRDDDAKTTEVYREEGWILQTNDPAGSIRIRVIDQNDSSTPNNGV